jgi:Stage II sporulation protein E (SpoIIE)
MFGQGKEGKQTMTDQAPCPRCRQKNPPRYRYCGSCGASLTSGEQLATRREYRPVPSGRAWPAKLDPAGKALAVGVTALVAEAGLSWLRRRIGTEERSSVLSARELDAAVPKRLLCQSLEEVLIQELVGEHRSRVLAWRAVRSIIYSDGLVEAHDPKRELFGFPRLRALVAEHGEAGSLGNFLLEELYSFVGVGWEQEDDITLLTLRRSSSLR